MIPAFSTTLCPPQGLMGTCIPPPQLFWGQRLLLESTSGWPTPCGLWGDVAHLIHIGDWEGQRPTGLFLLSKGGREQPTGTGAAGAPLCASTQESCPPCAPPLAERPGSAFTARIDILCIPRACLFWVFLPPFAKCIRGNYILSCIFWS